MSSILWAGRTVLVCPSSTSPTALSTRRPQDVATLPVPAELVLALLAWNRPYADAVLANPDAPPLAMPASWKQKGHDLALAVRAALPLSWRVGVLLDGMERPTYLHSADVERHLHGTVDADARAA